MEIKEFMDKPDIICLNLPNNNSNNLKIILPSKAQNNNDKLCKITTVIVFRLLTILIIAGIICVGLGHKYKKIKLFYAGIIGIFSCLSIICVTCYTSYKKNNQYKIILSYLQLGIYDYYQIS